MIIALNGNKSNTTITDIHIYFYLSNAIDISLTLSLSLSTYRYQIFWTIYLTFNWLDVMIHLRLALISPKNVGFPYLKLISLCGGFFVIQLTCRKENSSFFAVANSVWTQDELAPYGQTTIYFTKSFPLLLLPNRTKETIWQKQWTKFSVDIGKRKLNL